MLVIFAGLPGTGKSTIAKELARRTGATYVRIDSVEQALAKSHLGAQPVEDAGYQVGYAVAADNLRIGRTVIADSVNPIALSRTAWLETAERLGCAAIEVEVVCSDPIEHRRRVETRSADVLGHSLPTWQNVLDHEYDAWDREHIVIDTAGKPPQHSVDTLLAQLPSLRPAKDN